MRRVKQRWRAGASPSARLKKVEPFATDADMQHVNATNPDSQRDESRSPVTVAPASADVSVSAVVATLNEERHIEQTIRGLIDQDLPETIEILIVDGGSTDRTRSIVERVSEANSRTDRRIVVLDNPHRRTPYAFNIGINAASGKYVAILGAHAFYPPNYLSACLATVRSHTAPTAASGGIVTMPGSNSHQARIVVAALTSPFGSSRKSFRTATAGPADTIPFPIVEKRNLMKIGGYDERLLRNQDNDLSARLVESGVQLLLTPDVQASYFAQRDVRAMFRYGWRNGWWNAKAFALGGKGMRVRHFAPGVMVTMAIVVALELILGRPIPRRASASAAALGAVGHLGLGFRSLPKGPERLPATLCILGLHLTYGSGSVASGLVHLGGIIRRLIGRADQTSDSLRRSHLQQNEKN
jgi:succinoglycan biosynthesis protein ExoA